MREKEKSTTLLFIRHGKTDFPEDRIYCDDREDPPLNDAGRTQAQSAADWLTKAGIQLDALYCSPTLRTRQTAEPIARALGLDPALDDRLTERHFGIWEGLYFHEIMAKFPEEHRQWKTDNAGFAPRGGETIYQMLERLQAARDAILAKYHGGTVAVVTHVGPIRAFVADAIGLPVPYYRRVTVDNASLTRIDFGRSQNNLMFLNIRNY